MTTDHPEACSDAGRWVLVAGGSGGLGSAISRSLAEDGWNVALTYRRNAAAAEKIAREVTGLGRSSRIVQLDLTDPEAARDVVDEVSSSVELGGVVYAAGPHIPMKYVSAITPEIFSQTVDVDAKGCFNLLQPALRHLRENGGSVLAVSTPGITRYPKRDLLSVAPKAAVQAVIRGIAVEEGRFNVRANCIAVGLIEGEGMWDQLLERGDYTEEMFAVARKTIPLPRFGSVHDIAEAARFLMSDRASWITGQTLTVDGGYSV
ncbi:SDR family NAD(P)-dependent oxidoreductase [Rhodococcus chondri]|uniref:SDR family oxidoreductase n=1 Tax=Rhodococcus chondri TaxID=3065941 RepID=A0ABU7JTD1_9NOCA|nr:SDR family oxidoreductase [Rhodococcus sp. CC-R104]MEE2033022.1 SDR family oxidoreductase [Rhodococcus sp. CC-R104]